MTKSCSKTTWVKWGRWLLPLVAFAVVFALARFSAPLYHAPIVQVTALTSSHRQAVVDNFGNHDVTVTQHVTARWLNTMRRGQRVRLTNQYTKSGAVDSPVAKGQQLFVTHGSRTWQVSDHKRDGVVLGLFAMTLTLLLLVMRRRFWLTAASIGLNTLLFWAALHIEVASHQELAFVLFAVLAVAFTVATTLFITRWTWLTVVVSASTILATAAAVLIGYTVFAATGYRGIHLETVKYVTQAPQLLFFVQVIIGSLGAVMDECADIAVALFQLPGSARTRFNAGLSIGRNVMGPLIAVLFMLFIAETLTEAVLWLRNGNAISTTVAWVMGLGFAQSLVSAFGIVLAVPLTSGLAAWLAKEVRA